MIPAKCPYIDEKCGTHADCIKCTPHKKWINYLKSKIETTYCRFLADDAAMKNARYINEWHNDGLITDADKADLRTYNGQLWWVRV